MELCEAFLRNYGTFQPKFKLLLEIIESPEKIQNAFREFKKLVTKIGEIEIFPANQMGGQTTSTDEDSSDSSAHSDPAASMSSAHRTQSNIKAPKKGNLVDSPLFNNDAIF